MTGENSARRHKNFAVHKLPDGEVNETTPRQTEVPFQLLGDAIMTYAEIAKADLN